ncbi:MAG: hypothetical protein DLM73_05060 [Chthoniobacterales bacterium]|nr:MAG: hypothetical protein DLM73_05060 [Chthoniobacterales bacterium]
MPSQETFPFALLWNVLRAPASIAHGDDCPVVGILLSHFRNVSEESKELTAEDAESAEGDKKN